MTWFLSVFQQLDALKANFPYSEDVNKNPAICSALFKCIFDISVSLSAKEKSKLSQKTKF